jgi:hypothetical protein
LRFPPFGRRLLGMLRLVCALVLALFLSVAPAFAQDAPVCTGVGEEVVGCGTSEEPTVGEPDVITDPADEVDEEPVEPADPRAEQHVLGDSAEAESEDGTADRGPRTAGTAPAAPAPAAAASPTATAAPAPPASPAQRLPFTGVDAWVLALAGSLLLAAGLRMRQLA